MNNLTGDVQLTTPGTILLSKLRISEATGGYIADNFHISTRISTTKFLGIIGDLAEYGLDFVPAKKIYNNIPNLEFLSSEDKKYLGNRLEILSSFEKVLFPTMSDNEWDIERFLPKYYGTCMQENNTVLLHLVPPGYKSFYVFNGAGISELNHSFMSSFINNWTYIHDDIYHPTIIRTRSSSTTIRPHTIDADIGEPEIPVNITDPLYKAYLKYIQENAAVKLEFSNEESDYFRLVLLTILPSGEVENINIVQLGYETSENPYRNLDKYLLREESGINRYKYFPLDKFTKDLTSGTILSSGDLRTPLRQNKTEYRDLTSWGERKILEYCPNKTYTKGDIVKLVNTVNFSESEFLDYIEKATYTTIISAKEVNSNEVVFTEKVDQVLTYGEGYFNEYLRYNGYINNYENADRNTLFAKVRIENIADTDTKYFIYRDSSGNLGYIPMLVIRSNVFSSTNNTATNITYNPDNDTFNVYFGEGSPVTTYTKREFIDCIITTLPYDIADINFVDYKYLITTIDKNGGVYNFEEFSEYLHTLDNEIVSIEWSFGHFYINYANNSQVSFNSVSNLRSFIYNYDEDIIDLLYIEGQVVGEGVFYVMKDSNTHTLYSEDHHSGEMLLHSFISECLEEKYIPNLYDLDHFTITTREQNQISLSDINNRLKQAGKYPVEYLNGKYYITFNTKYFICNSITPIIGDFPLFSNNWETYYGKVLVSCGNTEKKVDIVNYRELGEETWEDGITESHVSLDLNLNKYFPNIPPGKHIIADIQFNDEGSVFDVYINKKFGKVTAEVIGFFKLKDFVEENRKIYFGLRTSTDDG
jgi:hypothetical protein